MPHKGGVYYVPLDGITDDLLGFLGYVLVAENEEFRLFRDYRGEEYVVHKARPYIYVDDPNDAEILSARSKKHRLITAPSE